MDPSRIAIIAAGGGGSRITAAMAAAIASPLRTIAIDTDRDALTACGLPTRLVLGRGHGTGTGGDLETGQKLAAALEGRLSEYLTDCEVAIVVACLGGGTGSVVAPAALRAANKAGVATLCVATLPFSFEGDTRRDAARHALVESRLAADATLVIPCDRLFEGRDGGVDEAFPKVDQQLGVGMVTLWQLLTYPGYLDIDYAEIANVANPSRGIATLAWGDGRGRRKADAAVRQALANPLLGSGEVLGNSDAVLVSIVGGPDLTLKEVGNVMAAIKDVTPSGVDLLMGTSVSEEWKGRVTVSLVVATTAAAAIGDGRAEAETFFGSELQSSNVIGIEPPSRPGGKHTEQITMDLEGGGRGRFENTEATIQDGQDLDVPTYQRRGIRIER